MTRDNASHEEPQLDDMVRRAKAGDGSAWQRLDHEMRTRFGWVAERRLGGQLGARADRSDMVQEAFLAAWKNMAEFRGDTFAQFCCWYDRILENKCRELIRRHHEKCRDMDLETPLPEGSSGGERLAGSSGSRPSQQAIRSEEIGLVHDAIDQLDDDHGAVIRLRNLEDLDWDEVARCLGRSKDATRQLWNRAIAKLTEVLRAGSEEQL